MSQTDFKTEVHKKLLFIRSPQHSLVMVEKYLLKRGYEVFNEENLNTALEVIRDSNPDYIFIALDHIDHHIDAFFNQLVLNSKSVVVPYIVSVHNKDVLKLMQAQSSSPIKIHPPLTGPSIQRSILKYEKDLTKDHTVKESSQRERTSKKSDQTAVLKGTKFILNQDTEKSSRFDFKHQKYNGPKESLVLNKATKALKPKVLTTLQKSKINSFFENNIKQDLEKDLTQVVQNKTIEETTSGFTLLIECPGISGAFLFTSKFKFSLSEIEHHLNKFAEGLSNILSEKIEGDDRSIDQSSVFEVKISEVTDLDKIHVESNYQATLSTDSKQSFINFYNLENSPFSSQNKSENGHYLELDSSLIKIDSVITFDIYFELKQNQKFIRYLKDGATITSEIHKKLSLVPGLYTDIQSEYDWYKYAMSSFIENTITAKKTESTRD